MNKKKISRIEKRITRLVGQAVMDYKMINEGDKIIIGMSGGKDSFLLFDMLVHFRNIAPVSFDIIPLHLDIGFDSEQVDLLKEYTACNGYECLIESDDISDIINKHIKEDKNPCSLCSRIKRGALYTKALELGCNKLALGHHRNDLIETFLLNTFYNGTIGTMPAIYESCKPGLYVIRPLISVSEDIIIEQSAKYKKYMYNPNADCPYVKRKSNLKREQVKNLIMSLKNDIPHIENSIYASLSNIHTKEMLDRRLID